MRVQIRALPDQMTLGNSLLCWSRNLLFAIGILALGYYAYVLADARIYQAYQTRQLEQAVVQPAVASPAGETAHSPTPIDVSPVLGALPNPVGFGAPTRLGSVLGQIKVSKIDLAVVILEGTDKLSLRRAVGHISGTALPGQQGNVAIAGHRDTFFRNLRKIEKNDEITVATLNGSYRYIVDFSEVVEPTAMEVLNPSADATLTLVTCYPYSYVGHAPKRMIVRAHLVVGAN